MPACDQSHCGKFGGVVRECVSLCVCVCGWVAGGWGVCDTESPVRLRRGSMKCEVLCVFLCVFDSFISLKVL